MSYSPFILGLTDVGQSQASKFFVADGNGDFEFQDDDKVVFGDGADASIYWNAAGSKVKAFSENVALELGHASSTTTILGNLVVSGTTTTVDVEVVNTANGVIFEGSSADDYETTLLCVNPTADRTVNLADSAGTLVPFAVAPAAGVQITSTPAELNILDGVTATAAELNILVGVTSSNAEINILDGVTSTAAELNILDGVTSTAAELNYLDITTLGTAEDSKAVTVSAGSKITLAGIEIEGTNFDINGGNIDGTPVGDWIQAAGHFTDLSCSTGAFALANLNIDGGSDIGDALADDDLFIIDDGGAGTNRKCAASRLKTYVGSSSLSVETDLDLSNGDTVSADVTLIHTGRSGCLYASNWTVKLPENAAEGTIYRIKKICDCSQTVTVEKNGSDTIDGGTSVVLYHQYESVTVVSDGADYHII